MSQQESQRMNDGHSKTMAGELTPLWSSRFTVCVCVWERELQWSRCDRNIKISLFWKNRLWPVPSILASVLRNYLDWFNFVFPGRKNELEGTFERWRASDWRMTHPEWLRCRISAVSESPCSSDRERDRGEAERGGWVGGWGGWVEREAERGRGKQRKLGGWKNDGGRTSSFLPPLTRWCLSEVDLELCSLCGCLPIHHHAMSSSHTGCRTCLWSHTLQCEEAQKQLTTKSMFIWHN